MRRHGHRLADTNNSAASKLFVINSNFGDETKAITLTREPPNVFAAPISVKSNAENGTEKLKLDEMLRALRWDSGFQSKYSYPSLFLIGAGAYGYVFRVVSNASGSVNNPLYSEAYVRYLQVLRKTKSRRKAALLDSYRDSLCLDLVGMKVEHLSEEDVSFNSSNKIQLAKEFCMLSELFRNNTSTNALVGFPLPIEFGFIGTQRLANNLRKVSVFDKCGKPSNYLDTFVGQSSILSVTPADVTNISYFTMELVGPNLDEWRQFFAPQYTQNGKMVFSVQTTLKLMDQVLCRLLVMHRKNMVHLDLKPDNLCMGLGKMCNTVYLLDYGLSKICTDEAPTITMGSRRYMSVGVLNFQPANYMMDIESWFYVLIVLLIDHVPWSDEVILCSEATNASHDHMVLVATQLKKMFWGDKGNLDRKLFQSVIDRVEMHHKNDVPDIKDIITNIYLHISRMRNEFYPILTSRMHADISNEESDLFKRYKTLRKLLLFAYDCDFSHKGSCFANDKDLLGQQAKRREKFPMLVYAEYGRNWQWDWDVWYDEMLHAEDSADRLSSFPENTSNRNAASRESPDEQSFEDALQLPEPTGMPVWMKYYLTRVLGSIENTAALNAGVDEALPGQSAREH